MHALSDGVFHGAVAATFTSVKAAEPPAVHMNGRAFDGAQIGVERLGTGRARAARARAINAAAAAPLPAECERPARAWS